MIRFFSGIVLIVLFGLGCKDEITESCMDINYGKAEVDPENKFILPYHGNETLVFLDSVGIELKLKSPFSLFPFYLDAIDSIDQGPCAGISVAYGKLEHISFTFRNDSLGYNLHLQHSVNLELDENRVHLYDDLYGTYYKQTTPPFFLGASFNFITDSRGNNLGTALLKQHAQFAETLSLRSRTFTKVYYDDGHGGDAVYYNQEFGFVGFKEGSGRLWVLDRIE